MSKLRFIRKQGEETASLFDELARLRIAVFREYPYLYEGSLAYEKEYLAPYAQSGRSFLFAVYDGEQMVGATTCLPLPDETPDIRQPFLGAGFDTATLFYFGESILLPEYRGLGLGHRFFDERESHACSFGTYSKACFLSVERPENHPAKPAGYRSNEAFWRKRGYQKRQDIQARLEWPDRGETEATSKSLTAWLGNL